MAKNVSESLEQVVPRRNRANNSFIALGISEMETEEAACVFYCFPDASTRVFAL